jgi:type III secretion protein D
MSATLELRVLSGLHREARCPAAHGHLVGTDTACDIVLADVGLPARAARLILNADGWNLSPGDSEPDPDAVAAAPYNQPLPLGPVWLTVARPDDPWEAPPDAQASNAAPAGADTAELPAGAATPDPESNAGYGSEAVHAVHVNARSAGTADSAARPGRRHARLMTLSLAAVGLAIAIALILAWLPSSVPKEPMHTDPRIAAEQSIPTIQAALEHLGLASRLRVALAPSGTTAQVTGWVRDAAERDALAAALAQIWPMPAMRISIEADVLRTARTILSGYAVKYEPRYDGEGRLSILGIASDDAVRTEAVEAVRAQLPGMTIMGNAIQLAPAVTDALTRELAAAGLSGVTLTWKRHRLDVDASKLDDDQMIRFEHILSDFNRRFFDVAAPPDTERAAADTVPFGILSVVSGKTPFIVLEDGSKLLVGGTYRRYRLTGIEDKRLTFEGPRPAIVLR